MSELQWHYGSGKGREPNPGSLYCDECGSEVWLFKEGPICSNEQHHNRHYGVSRDPGSATVPSEAWDRTHPDHEFWTNGRGWCYDRECPDHSYGPGGHHKANDAVPPVTGCPAGLAHIEGKPCPVAGCGWEHPWPQRETNSAVPREGGDDLAEVRCVGVALPHPGRGGYAPGSPLSGVHIGCDHDPDRTIPPVPPRPTEAEYGSLPVLDPAVLASPLAARRQRARVAYYDDCAKPRGGPEGSAIALEAAIESATRVRITPDIILAGGKAPRIGLDEQTIIIKAAFQAAGFEVVE